MAATRIAWSTAPLDRHGRRAVAWRMLRTMLTAEGYPDATLSNPCPRCGGPHGPIQVAGAPWSASVTYAGAVAVAAVHPRVGGDSEAPTGFAIDAEPLVDTVRDAAGGVPGGLLRWVRAEAAAKAVGRGLRLDVDEISVTETSEGWTALLPGIPVAVTGWEPAVSPPGVLLSVALAPAAAVAPAHRAMP
ncbi:4-phosphopantetheinyl transferase family protein [Microbacterium dextranolyticum]|nr:4-phosphopantetheinyl transferase family protein [Microbacterium dextranolyticum]MBM7463583.1 hypothetical protein [Microbacterium dextranolyticum]